jgi:hypothetical protein
VLGRSRPAPFSSRSCATPETLQIACAARDRPGTTVFGRGDRT